MQLTCTKIMGGPLEHVLPGGRSPRPEHARPSSSDSAREAASRGGEDEPKAGRSIAIYGATTRSGVGVRRGISCKHVMLEGGLMVRRTDAGARSRGASDSRSRRRSRNPYLTWTSDKDLCTRTHAPGEWRVRVMARAGCGHFTSTNGLEGEDVILRQRRPEKVAVCGSSPSAADGSVLATARQRCAAKSRTSSTRRSAHRRLVEAAAATAAGNLGVAITNLLGTWTYHLKCLG